MNTSRWKQIEVEYGKEFLEADIHIVTDLVEPVINQSSHVDKYHSQS